MGEVLGGKALPSLAGRKGRELPTTPVSLRGLRHVGNHLGLAGRECGQPEHLYPNRHTVEVTAIPGTVAISTVLFGVRRMKIGGTGAELLSGLIVLRFRKGSRGPPPEHFTIPGTSFVRAPQSRK